jgi:hypothetical protein
VDGRVLSSNVVRGELVGYAAQWTVVVSMHHDTRHNTPIHSILSTSPQLSISQKSLETLYEDGNVMPKQVGATINS